MIVALLKFVLVAASLACGAFFLATGLGVDIPLIKYQGLEAYGVPVGIVLLVVGVALARFWRVSTTETFEEIITTTSSDGGSTTSQKKSKITTTFTPPGG